MNEIRKREIFSQAVKLWGETFQMNMAVEECAELIQAIMKFRRNKVVGNVKANLCEEIADVEIMLEQLRTILNEDVLIDNIKEEKLERLEKLME